MALQAGTVLEFSIDSATTGYGIIQSIQETATTERLEVRGELGNTKSIQEFDDKNTIAMNIAMLDTPSSPPAIGSTFTFETVVYYLESVQHGRTIDGIATYDITGTNFPNLP